MDRLKIVSVAPDISNLVFNPIWKNCIGEILMYNPKVKQNQIVKQGQPLASMETSRGIMTVFSPINGKIINIERSFLDNPCEMDSNVSLFTIRERNE